MPKPLVYLAGPITGLTYGNSTNWRDYAAEALREMGIEALSPMRGKTYLRQSAAILDAYEDFPLSSQKGMTTRDRWDTTRCDVLLVNLSGAERVSIGTMIELGWADAARRPIVVVMEKEGNCMDHAMVREVAGYIVDDLDAAIALVGALLVA